VGFIAVDCHGNVHARNSDRVKRRPDLGSAEHRESDRSIAVAVLHNAITPYPVLAELVAQVALDILRGESEPDGWITLVSGIPLAHGPENAVYCDARGEAVRVVTTDGSMVRGRQVGAAVYIHSTIYRDGERLGLTQFEPIVTVVDGIIETMSGQQRLPMSYRRAR
jgi:hypothetical protein